MKKEEEDRQREIMTTKIEFERLSEFFFDLCLSWCQHLDIETFLFFINGVFLNITRGHHISVSTFKPLREIGNGSHGHQKPSRPVEEA